MTLAGVYLAWGHPAQCPMVTHPANLSPIFNLTTSPDLALRSERHSLTTPVASLPSRRPQAAARENISFSYWACTAGAASLPWCWCTVCVICGPDAHAVLCGHWPQGSPRGTGGWTRDSGRQDMFPRWNWCSSGLGKAERTALRHPTSRDLKGNGAVLCQSACALPFPNMENGTRILHSWCRYLLIMRQKRNPLRPKMEESHQLSLHVTYHFPP